MLNSVVLAGNLGNDPDIHFNSEGEPIASKSQCLQHEELAQSLPQGRLRGPQTQKPRKNNRLVLMAGAGFRSLCRPCVWPNG